MFIRDRCTLSWAIVFGLVKLLIAVWLILHIQSPVATDTNFWRYGFTLLLLIFA